jgi:hypothetical protein
MGGPGDITLSNANNTISSMSTNATVGALSVKNNAALSVGAINATGNVTIANTAGLTLMSGQGITTTTGNIVLTGTKFINAAGVNALTVSNGKSWQVWSSNIAPLRTLANGGDDTGSLVNNFVQYNATYGSSQVLGTGNGLLYTFAPILSGSLVGTITKTYDATTTAALTGTAAVGPLGSDVVSVIGTGAGLFADKNVGTGKAVTVSGYSLTGTDAANYSITQPTGLTAGITAKSLTVTGTTLVNKVYDGTTTATLSNGALVGVIAADAAKGFVDRPQWTEWSTPGRRRRGDKRFSRER